MGVYIKGMEMPKDGDKVYMITFSDGKVCASDKPFEWHEVVHVPPHGDLIDKKTVSENLASVLNKKNPPFSYPDWNDAIVAVLTAPTIIPASDEDTNVLGKEEGE